MNAHISHDENKGQKLLTGGANHVLNSVKDIEDIGQEVPFLFLQKKAEKLTTALYLVTGFLSDTEPIKRQIRECGLSVLSGVTGITDSHMSDTLCAIKSDIEKVVAFLEVAAIAGFVSDMNFAILKEEFLELAKSIENRKLHRFQGRYIFSREFFETADLTQPLTEKEREFYKRHIQKDKPNVLYENKENPALVNKKETQDRGLFVEGFKKSVAKKDEKNSRRVTILRLIEDKGEQGEVSIKDITGHIPDCGEKTIQRELGALVDEGVLKKTGERRWSRYSLNR